MPAALWLWGAKRRLKQTALTSPLAAASSARAAVSAAVTPSGFSQTTCRPARRAAVACSAWTSLGLVTWTAASESSLTRASTES